MLLPASSRARARMKPTRPALAVTTYHVAGADVPADAADIDDGARH